jgi:hypothetical protein
MGEGSRHAAPGLDEDAARELLSDTERVRRVARSHRRVVAIPLYVLGALLLVYAFLGIAEHARVMDLQPGESRAASSADLAVTMFLDTYWATVGAVGLVAIGVWFRRRSQRSGAGPGGRAWIVAGVVLLVLVLTGGFLPIAGLFFVAGFLTPTLFIVVPLLVIAAQRRSAQLAAWVVAFGVVTILAGLGFFTNRFGDLVRLTGLESSVPIDVIVAADLGVLVLFALVLLVAAERVRRSGAHRSS